MLYTLRYDYMAKLTIWVPDKELETIRGYCIKNGYHTSVFMWKSTIHQINTLEGKKEVVKCDFCASPSLGRFTVTTYNLEKGEVDVARYLCKLHLKSAQREGAVKDAP